MFFQIYTGLVSEKITCYSCLIVLLFLLLCVTRDTHGEEPFDGHHTVDMWEVGVIIFMMITDTNPWDEQSRAWKIEPVHML